MKKGIYVQGVEQTIGRGDDETKLVKHTICQISDPEINEETGKSFVENPVLWDTYLKPGVLEIMPSGTPITFEFDVKQKRRDDGSTYSKPVPVEIKAVARGKSA